MYRYTPKVYRYTPKVYRYTLAKNGQNTKCTGTLSMCTGTHDLVMPRMCVLVQIFHILILKSILHFKTIPNSHIKFIKTIPNSPWNLFSTQFLFHFLSSFKTFPLISPNIILIWVTTHIHTKYQDLLGFDQNPNSISFHLTMNPTTKEGFHNYLVPCGLYQL